MIFKAQSDFSRNLLSLPESGMGYQIIDAKRVGRSTSDRFIVYNSELIIDLNNNFEENKRFLLKDGYAHVFRQSDFIELSMPTLVSRSLVRIERKSSEIAMKSKGRHTGGTAAINNSPVFANGSDKFVRLSHYKDDKRIDFENKRLKEGSFTTTYWDYSICKQYNDDPIDRYALPSDDAINWVFTILPRSYNSYRPGIVQPAYNHDGGGVEA